MNELAAIPKPDEYVTVTQIAEVLGVHPVTVRNWIRAEQIPTYSRGDRRRKLVRREDAEYLASPRVIDRRRGLNDPVRSV